MTSDKELVTELFSFVLCLLTDMRSEEARPTSAVDTDSPGRRLYLATVLSEAAVPSRHSQVLTATMRTAVPPLHPYTPVRHLLAVPMSTHPHSTVRMQEPTEIGTIHQNK
jgi:hypothetical protein